MKSRRFRPVTVDVLEERMVLSAFAVPFTLTTPTTEPVNPRFLILTGRTENQINSAITSAFTRFSHAYTSDLNAYIKGISKPNADSTKLLDTFNTNVGNAFNRLSTDMLLVSKKLPYGGVNLNPVLQNRVVGSTGVTDTTTGVNTPSLQTQITSLLNAGNEDQVAGVIATTQASVQSDVKFYINQGITYGYFKLGRGAVDPSIS